ncbi:MAG: suppressor of fused domain protein [Burkholderiales bacterium]|nr:suppressor of fused domain protein [Burkholderiales bacterium]
MNQDFQKSLEAVWEEREVSVYPTYFGPFSRGVFVLSADLFNTVFGQTAIDPRWLHHGVFEFSPTASRKSWLYVTSGLSNPWETDPSEYDASKFSEIGIEHVIESLNQSTWPIMLLERILAYNILLCAGRYGDPSSLDYGHRIPLGTPITPENETGSFALSHILIGKPEHYPSSFTVASGKVNLLHLVGITESERDFAKKHSSDTLVDVLKKNNAYPVTNPKRLSVV